MISPATSIAGVTQMVDPQVAMEEAFPSVDPGMIPLGSRILVQLRQPKTTTNSGRIILADQSRDAEKWNTQVALIRAIGPVAFKSRSSLEAWPEGAWVKVGDFVRVPKYNGDRVEVPQGQHKVLFAIFNDLELIAKVSGDPLAILAFV